MTEFASKKWFLFVESPTSLFKREFVKRAYFYLDKISSLKVSKLLIIGKEDNNLIYISAAEDKNNYLKVNDNYQSGKIEKIFSRFKKIIKNYKLKGKNEIGKVIKIWEDVSPIVIYTYYLERVLMEENEKINLLKSKEKKRLKKIMKENGNIREKCAKIIYNKYNHLYQKLKKKNKNIDYYLLTEFLEDKKLNKKEIIARKKFYVELTTKAQVTIYTGKKAKTILKKEGFYKIKIKTVKTVSGLVAYPGKISGPVVVIRKLTDFKKKNYQGRILISPRTIIEYNPYLKKVKAIITDFGGINCHAAIIAREFKIPCLVGTKIGSQVFKTGDKLEVDANKGIVKKI